MARIDYQTTRRPMSVIGRFKRTEDGFTGAIDTLTIRARVWILPADQCGNAKAPDWHVTGSTAEIGAGWTTTTRDGTSEYVSVKLDDPSFAHAIRARLTKAGGDGGPKGDEYELIWSRE